MTALIHQIKRQKDRDMEIYRSNSDDKFEPLAVRPQRAAELLDISPSTLERLTRAGEIPHAKVRGCTLYSVENLKNWLAKQIEGGSHAAH